MYRIEQMQVEKCRNCDFCVFYFDCVGKYTILLEVPYFAMILL